MMDSFPKKIKTEPISSSRGEDRFDEEDREQNPPPSTNFVYTANPHYNELNTTPRSNPLVQGNGHMAQHSLPQGSGTPPNPIHTEPVVDLEDIAFYVPISERFERVQVDRTQVQLVQPDLLPTRFEHEMPSRANGSRAPNIQSLEDIWRQWDSLIPAEQLETFQAVVRLLLTQPLKTPRDFEKAITAARRQFHIAPKKAQILHALKFGPSHPKANGVGWPSPCGQSVECTFGHKRREE